MFNSFTKDVGSGNRPARDRDRSAQVPSLAQVRQTMPISSPGRDVFGLVILAGFEVCGLEIAEDPGPRAMPMRRGSRSDRVALPMRKFEDASRTSADDVAAALARKYRLTGSENHRSDEGHGGERQAR